MNEALGSIFSGAIPTQFMGSQNTPADAAGPSDSKSNTQERIAKEIHSRVEEAKGLQQKSLELHEKADNTDDPEEAENIRHEAREIDKKAAKLMKIAERLEKGWIQG
ncbi:hypothetical protein FPANT_14241, partial [Fusarium pseudoanthophilum]